MFLRKSKLPDTVLHGVCTHNSRQLQSHPT